MATKVIIRGIGKAGRLFLKHSFDIEDIDVVAVADDAAYEHADNLAYLLNYDTVHGVSNHSISTLDGDLVVDGRKVKVVGYNNIPTLNEYGASVIVDFTGNLSSDTAQDLVNAGYKVIANNFFEGNINDNDIPVITTANISSITSSMNIISTNPDIESVAQVVQQIDSNGISNAMLTFIKSATSAMSVDDTFVASGTYDAGRGCFENMIVTANSAGKQLGRIIPKLNGKITGNTIRVPSISGFIAQIDATCNKSVTTNDINSSIKGISSQTLAYYDDPISPTDTRSLFAPAFVSSKTMSINVANSSMIRAYVFYHPENVSVEISTEIIRRLALL